MHISGDGKFTKLAHDWLREHTGTRAALLTHSCTAALEMMPLLLDIGPGDEVIMPSYTFVSTANAFVLRGAVPVFVDIRPDTLNIDELLVEQAITAKTKAVMAVHYAGIPADMDALRAICERHSLHLLEDAAQGIGASYRGAALGTIGKLGALSFHETKNLISGEGGALFINDERLIERAEIVREKGTNRSRFIRGQVDKYTWVDVGSSYLPSDIIAAFLYAQLQQADHLLEQRLRIWQAYHNAFAELETLGLVRRPRPQEGGTHNGHIYYLLANSARERDALLTTLKRSGIAALFHYIPLHSSPAGQKYGRTFGSLDVTDRVSDTLLRLPMHLALSENDVIRIRDIVSITLANAQTAS